MTTTTNSAPIEPMVVTPALGPVPAIYVPRSSTSPSVWYAVGQLVHHVAARAKAGA